MKHFRVKWLVLAISLLTTLLSPIVLPTHAQSRTVITADNASHISQVGRLGYGAVITSAWTDDGSMFALGLSREIRIYKQGQSEPLVIPDQRMVRILLFSADNQLLASSDDTGLVRLWNIATGNLVATWGQERVGIVTGMHFMVDSPVLAISFYDEREQISGAVLGTGIRLWDYEDNSVSLRVRTSPYRGDGNMAFNQDNSLIATTSRDSQNGSGLPIANLIVYAASSGETIQQLIEVRPFFRQLIFSPTDPDLLVSIDERGVVRFWNVRQGQELFALTLLDNRVNAAAFSPDGTKLATGGTDGEVRVWDVSNGVLLQVFDNQPRDIERLYMTESGQILAFSDAQSPALAWDARSGQIISTFTFDNVTPPLIDMGFDPSGQRIIAAGKDATARIWHISSGEETIAFQGNSADWDAVAISDNGSYLAWMDAQTGQVHLFAPWEATTPFIRQFQTVSSIYVLRFSPNAEHIFVAGFGNGQPYQLQSDPSFEDGWLRMWDNQNSFQPANDTLLVSHFVYAAAQSPTQPLIAYTSQEHLWLLDLSNGRTVALTNGGTWYDAALVFSPDGSLLAAGGPTIELWDTKSQSLVREIPTNSYGISPPQIAFSHDGTLIAAGSGNSLKIFDVRSGDMLADIHAEVDDITRIAFSPDGTMVATSSLDGTIGLWGIP